MCRCFVWSCNVWLYKESSALKQIHLSLRCESTFLALTPIVYRWPQLSEKRQKYQPTFLSVWLSFTKQKWWIDSLFVCSVYFFYPTLTCSFQAILFYIPRWLWKNWEAGKVSALRMDLNLGIISDVEKKLKKKLLIDYLYSNLKHHNFWAYRYFFCEFLALLNVSGRISDTRRLVACCKGFTRRHFSCLHLLPETLSWAAELCKRWQGD